MWCSWGRWGLRGLRGVTPSRAAVGALHYDIRSSYIPFDTIVNERRSQAKKSLLVQVNSEKSFPELHSYCSQFGTVLGVHHYTTSNSHHFMLVEFSTEENVSNLLASTTFIQDSDVIPVQSKFLWFRPQNNELRSNIRNIINFSETNDVNKLHVKNACVIPAENLILRNLLQANSISEQIQMLYDMTCLKDLGTRLRYVTARQVESALNGLFPNATVCPFGSSVNGFGKMGCDLDLVVKFTSEDLANNLRSRLVFHTKKSTLTGRTQQQRYMEIISDMIQFFLPGCSHVRKILQARIPIIKFNQDYAGLDCDLSISSTSGLYMSELLYLYGNIDSRVRPLVFTIRKWAKHVALTNASPGKWITNFPLTLMVLFFLQNATDGAILPSFNYLRKHAGESDMRLTDDRVNCSFLRDIKDMKFISQNDSDLKELLHQFFEFYCSFDFSTQALSINEGRAIKKPDYAALYIINPLQINLNVSKNVSYEECERMKIEFRNAAWYLESVSETGNEKESWGLGVLLKEKSSSLKNKFVDYHRIVQVKDLFMNEKKELNDGDKFEKDIHKNKVNNNQIHDDVIEQIDSEISLKTVQNVNIDTEQSQFLSSENVQTRGRKVKRR
ncbi:mitochondrial poly(A) polymerase isoform X2 [Arctopsyche grandis]|uniref:mitochondrial poly(A) polymerase isoform X2 n=1 Tax=Arctopsyche grandis TaxID=121162 RepID=UPI00406D6ECF